MKNFIHSLIEPASQLKIAISTILVFSITTVYLIAKDLPAKYINQYDVINMDDGLSDNRIRHIIQDSRGFIWISTVNGLNRYDGHSIKVFRSNPEDPTTIVHPYVHDLVEDVEGRIWMVTVGGLCRYDPYTDRFTRFRKGHPLHNIWYDRGANIIADTINSVWILDKGFNLIQYNIITDSATIHDLTNFLPRKTRQPVYMINKSSNQDGWIRTAGGLIHLDIPNRSLRKAQYYEGNELKPLELQIINFHSNDQNQLYLSTQVDEEWRGFIYNVETKVLMSYEEAGSYDPGSHLTADQRRFFTAAIEEDSLYFIKHGYQKDGEVMGNTCSLITDNGILMIGTHGGGIFVQYPTTLPITNYRYDPNNSNSLLNPYIHGIYEDRDRGLLIASDFGASYFDYESNQFYRYSSDAPPPHQIPANTRLTYVHRDNRGTVYLLLNPGGPLVFNEKDRSLSPYINPIDSLNVSGLPRYDSKDRTYFWIRRPNRLLVYDSLKGTRTLYEPGKNSVPANLNLQNLVFTEDRRGDIWLNSRTYGPVRFRPDAGEFVVFEDHFLDGTGASKKTTVRAIFEDSKGNIWIGHTGPGVDIIPHQAFEKDSIYFINYNPEKQGIIGAQVLGPQAIAEDNSGSIWIATKQGISRRDPKSGKFKLFQYADNFVGLPWHGFYMGPSGKIYIGSFDHGVYSFHPDSIKENSHVPPVHIMSIEVNNRMLGVDIGLNDSIPWESPLEQTALFTESIELKHWQNDITFEFTALDYTDPKSNLYKYKLEGFNNGWVNKTADDPYATYTNLSPGKYIFKVLGSNNHGVWNEVGDSMYITIHPPWWATTWAYLGYGILAIGLIFTVRHYERRRFILREKARSLEEVNRLKTQFFTNISHEFRTPLTLILGPLKSISEGTFKGDTQTVFGMMIRNGQRLMRLINQLLDLSKLEAGSLTLDAGAYDIVEFSRLAKASFESAAEAKGISMEFVGSNSPIVLWFDPDKMERILFNLIANAIKFTPEGGRIEMKLEEDVDLKDKVRYKHGVVLVSVRDSGQGIPKKDLDRIFDRFYQADSSHKRKAEGTGVGLALVKEFVELHHGEITVESEEGWGTAFRITLPKGKDHLRQDELEQKSKAQQDEISEISEASTAELDIELYTETIKGAEPLTKEKLPHVLVVEDNRDMQAYLRTTLQAHFNIAEAENGRVGLEKAFEKIPDLVISDVMMPEMDGYEMCAKIKDDVRTSHIPVIILTAKADKDSTLEGLGLGADDYVQKPFDTDLLLARANNLIEQRIKLAERFRERFLLKDEEMRLNSKDEQFVRKLVEVVEYHLDNPELTVEKLGEEVGLTRTALYRKMVAIAGQKPTEFIRTIRLKKAAELISRDTATISEIAYSVGFSNLSHFSESFKKEYGVSPKDYRSSQ